MQYRMKFDAGRRKTRGHRAAALFGDIQDVGGAYDAPQAQQTANNDAAIEKVRQPLARAFRTFERKDLQGRVPRIICQERRRLASRFEIERIPGERVQVGESAQRVTSDLGGYGEVLLHVGAVVTRNTAVLLLDSRFDEPSPGGVEKCGSF